MKWYYKMKFLKMGRWTLSPADSETWHTEHTSRYFRRLFGFGKGTWVLHTLTDSGQYPFFPKEYFNRLYSYIAKNTKKDYKFLEKKLLTFYKLREKTKQVIPKITARNFSKLTNGQLISLYKRNRDWTHRMAIYDQFGWTAEDYWNPIMKKLLTKRFGIKGNSPEYHDVLFKLIKPMEISTTLLEKRDELRQAILIKQGKTTMDKSAKLLTKKYGWMPVFTYGTSWGKEYFINELNALMMKDMDDLLKEHNLLKDYKKIRNHDIKQTVAHYKITPEDLQIFIDFGMALDTRNEEEYLVSLCGFYLLPIYNEIAKRLYLSVKQLRNLCEHEIILALQNKIDPLKTLQNKGKVFGWGFDRAMKKRFFFTSNEAAKFFEYLQKKVEGLQGKNENKGLCASPGKISGRVAIVTSPVNNYKVEAGDILIAEATTVDYLPAMKKAAAFVTEVGGLTCHAAVVAREFGVPCVVGLKNATKNFKDGDMVKVDANEGVIRKL